LECGGSDAALDHSRVFRADLESRIESGVTAAALQKCHTSHSNSFF